MSERWSPRTIPKTLRCFFNRQFSFANPFSTDVLHNRKIPQCLLLLVCKRIIDKSDAELQKGMNSNVVSKLCAVRFILRVWKGMWMKCRPLSFLFRPLDVNSPLSFPFLQVWWDADHGLFRFRILSTIVTSVLVHFTAPTIRLVVARLSFSIYKILFPSHCV